MPLGSKWAMPQGHHLPLVYKNIKKIFFSETTRPNAYLSLFHINRTAVCAILRWVTEHRDHEADCRQISHRITQNVSRKAVVQFFYDYLTSHARLPQDGHAKICKTVLRKPYVVQFWHCIRAAIVRFSAVVVSFLAFLRQQ